MQDSLSISLNDQTKVLVVSDIHLRLPITRELGVIQNSLVDRVKDLSSHKQALLILNGDIFELWEQTDQTVADIIEGFGELTVAIQKFAKGRGHRVLYVVGNHDEQLATSPTDRAVVEHHWRAIVTNRLELAAGKKIIVIQHGHQYDPYNKPNSLGDSSGKKLVQGTMPVLQENLPKLFENIGDVTDRSLLGEFVIANFLYRMFVPVIAPLAVLVSLVFAYYYHNQAIVLGTIGVLAGLVIIMMVIGLISRFVSGIVLGGGRSFLHKLDLAQQKDKFNVLILGHTHQGGIFRRSGYVYVNSGCSDIVASHRVGWLLLPKFERHLQMSGLTIDYSKKQPIEYHHQTIPLVE